MSRIQLKRRSRRIVVSITLLGLFCVLQVYHEATFLNDIGGSSTSTSFLALKPRFHVFSGTPTIEMTPTINRSIFLNVTGGLLKNEPYPCRNQKISVANCSDIVNLACKSQLVTQFYHRVMDCLRVEYMALKIALQSIDNVCLVGFANREEFYLQLFPEKMSKRQLLCSEPPSLSFLTHAEMRIGDAIRDEETVVFMQYLERDSSAVILEDLEAMDSSTSNTRKAKIVLIHRVSKTRSFDGITFAKLCDRLMTTAQKFNTKLYVYTGEETVQRTIQIFHEADVIVGYHGAAMTNMLFASRQSCFIEISTYASTDMSRPWRTNSNALKKVRPDLNIFVYRIPLDHGWHTLNTSSVDVHEDADHYIKAFTNISLPKSDIDNVVNIAEACILKTNIVKDLTK